MATCPAPDVFDKVLSSLSGDKRLLLLILLDEMLLIELLDIDIRDAQEVHQCV